MEWDGLVVDTHDDVYQPHDDTFMLARAVKAHVGPGRRFLEVGCGAGIVAMTAARQGADVVATDINPDAVALCRRNAERNGLRVAAVEADLLHAAADALDGPDPLHHPFDVVAFNPPYLPTSEDEKVQGMLNHAFDGGPDGNRVVLEFAQQIAALPEGQRPGEILVIHSDLSDPKPLSAALGALGYREEVLEREKGFFEELWVRRFY